MISTNRFAKKQFTKGSNGWEGDNASGSVYGNQDIFGGPDSAYGDGAFGGFNHFKLRVGTPITH